METQLWKKINNVEQRILNINPYPTMYFTILNKLTYNSQLSK